MLESSSKSRTVVHTHMLWRLLIEEAAKDQGSATPQCGYSVTYCTGISKPCQTKIANECQKGNYCILFAVDMSSLQKEARIVLPNCCRNALTSRLTTESKRVVPRRTSQNSDKVLLYGTVQEADF